MRTSGSGRRPVTGPAGRPFWPAGEAAQADYEALRAHVLTTGVLPDSIATARFRRRGLAGLITCPATAGPDPVFTGDLLGARRPPWSPHEDPRVEALAAAYAVLLDAADRQPEEMFAEQEGTS